MGARCTGEIPVCLCACLPSATCLPVPACLVPATCLALPLDAVPSGILISHRSVRPVDATVRRRDAVSLSCISHPTFVDAQHSTVRRPISHPIFMYGRKLPIHPMFSTQRMFVPHGPRDRSHGHRDRLAASHADNPPSPHAPTTEKHLMLLMRGQSGLLSLASAAQDSGCWAIPHHAPPITDIFRLRS